MAKVLSNLFCCVKLYYKLRGLKSEIYLCVHRSSAVGVEWGFLGSLKAKIKMPARLGSTSGKNSLPGFHSTYW